MNNIISNEILALLSSHIKQLNSMTTTSFKIIKSQDSLFDKTSIMVQALTNIDDGILIIDSRSKLLFINKHAKKVLNCKKEDYVNKNISLLFEDSTITSINKISTNTYNFTYPTNKVATYTIKLNSIHNNNYLMITIKNETTINSLNKDLEKSNLKYNMLVNNIPDILVQLNKKGDIVSYTCGEAIDFSINPHKYLNKNIFEVLPIDIAKKTKSTIEKVLSTNCPGVFKSSMTKDNKVYHSIIRMYSDSQGQVMCLVRDISDKITIENKLEYLNIYDSLTGLFNRTYFENKLEYYNDPAFLPMGLVICDLNGLKLVNDTLGHSFGDIILKESANIIKSALSNYEEACRIGGDEFAIFFPNCSESLLEKYKSTILNKLNDYNLSNPKLPLSLSIGYNLKETMDIDMESIFIAADNNMYHEKLLQGIQNRNNILQGLVKSLSSKEYKNDDLKHSLCDYVIKVAKAINYPDQNMSNLKLFVNFHDLGQVSIPDNILQKIEPLTNEEINIIKRHSEVGYKISLSIPNLFHIADWILKHHEWWNGEGYPLNIKETDIPIECRIFSIVESYIAMISQKPYKKGLSKEEALTEIKLFSGKQFDPFLVNKFVDILNEESV